MLFGSLGIDRFYLGKIGTGLLKLCTLGGLGVWALVDFILIFSGHMKAKDGTPLSGYKENIKVAVLLFVLWVVMYITMVASGVVTYDKALPSNNSACNDNGCTYSTTKSQAISG